MGSFDLNAILRMLPFLIPIVLLELGLKVYCLFHIFRSEGLSRDRRIVWALVVVLVNLFGSLAYLLFGRAKEE